MATQAAATPPTARVQSAPAPEPGPSKIAPERVQVVAPTITQLAMDSGIVKPAVHRMLAVVGLDSSTSGMFHNHWV